MPKIRITAAAVRDLPAPPAGKQVLYIDDQLQGFGVRVGPASRVFYVESRVAGRTGRVTIRPSNVFTPEAARKEAKRLLGQMASGVDVNHAKAEARARTITLAEALEAYLKGRALKEQTATRHEGHDLSLKHRKRVEEAFGWAKTVGGMAQTVYRGIERVRASSLPNSNGWT